MLDLLKYFGITGKQKKAAKILIDSNLIKEMDKIQVHFIVKYFKHNCLKTDLR